MLQQHILYRQSNHDIAVWTSNHQLSSLWKKNSAARPGGPGRTYFGKIFVINGEQSVVRDLILWFWLVKLPEPHKQMWTYKKFALPSGLTRDDQVPAANTTPTVPWVESHCPFSSSPQCQRCCCIVPFSLSHFNLEVTDLNSAKQQWAPPSSAGPVVQSIHTSLATLIAWNIS